MTYVLGWTYVHVDGIGYHALVNVPPLDVYSCIVVFDLTIISVSLDEDMPKGVSTQARYRSNQNKQPHRVMWLPKVFRKTITTSLDVVTKDKNKQPHRVM